MAEQVERETKEFTAPGGTTVVFRAYLTGKESNALKAIMYAQLKINTSEAASGKVSLGEMPASFMLEQERKALEFLVVSVNGNTADPLTSLDALPESEYNAILTEMTKIRVPLAPRS